MAKKLNEYDYLYISARIHALENSLLTRERMERMLEARSDEEAAKILSECGYEEFTTLSTSAVEATLNRARLTLFTDLRKSVPDPALVDVFCIKYDYHNAKVLLKSAALGTNSTSLFIDAGRYPVETLAENFNRDNLGHYSETFRLAIVEAKAVLASSSDPQAADFILDRAYYVEFLAAAQSVGSTFLEGYVRLSLDAANLRSLVRACRMGRGQDFLKRVLMEGGNVSVYALIERGYQGGDIVSLFSRSPLREAAELGASLLKEGSLTPFERLCDNGVTHYLKAAKSVSFGEYPLLGYLYAKEAEFTTIRTILSGRLAGLSGDIIRERLREGYA